MAIARCEVWLLRFWLRSFSEPFGSLPDDNYNVEHVRAPIESQSSVWLNREAGHDISCPYCGDEHDETWCLQSWKSGS